MDTLGTTALEPSSILGASTKFSDLSLTQHHPSTPLNQVETGSVASRFLQVSDFGTRPLRPRPLSACWPSGAA